MKNRKKNSNNNKMSRRQFVRNAASVAAFTIVPRCVLARSRQTPPSEKINLASIASGGQAAWDLAQLKDLVNVVALCDVDDKRAADIYNEYPAVPKYKDFRIMLDKEDKNIDACLVATPDHVHAVATMAAIKHGKHVYCEKPLTNTIYEARKVAQTARKAGLATQMGNQGMAFEGNRLINEWLADGAIGNVYEVHAWSDRPTHFGKLLWPQGIDRPKDTPPVPPTLDWDLWLGPAPYRPYNPAYVPFKWRGFWDFGSGGLGDMGIHNIAPAFSALKLKAPTSVYASSTLVNSETLPLACIVHYDFPPRDNMPPVKLHWYDGGLLPARPDELEENRKLDPEDGLIFVGDKGTMLVTGWGGESPRLIPESKMRQYKRPPKTLPRSIGHHKEWVEACKGNGSTRSNFDFAGPLTEAVLLGTVAVRTGKKLNWDSQNLKITNVPDANKYLHRQYRPGWTL